eukprot:Clim_evm42s149 gene=Clim_evmTU42s149
MAAVNRSQDGGSNTSGGNTRKGRLGWISRGDRELSTATDLAGTVPICFRSSELAQETDESDVAEEKFLKRLAIYGHTSASRGVNPEHYNPKSEIWRRHGNSPAAVRPMRKLAFKSKDYFIASEDIWSTEDDDILTTQSHMSNESVVHQKTTGPQSSSPQKSKAPVSASSTSAASAQHAKAPTEPAQESKPPEQEKDHLQKPEQSLEAEDNAKSAEGEDDDHHFDRSPIHLRKAVPGINDMNDRAQSKLDRFMKMLNSPQVDIVELRKISWSGVPAQIRHEVWQLLCGYLPAGRDRRQQTLERKRKEYHALVERYYNETTQKQNPKIFHQITIDAPRTAPEIESIQHPVVQELLKRILFVWAIRHPASGYVQGINDLVCPFAIVFTQAKIGFDDDAMTYDMSRLSEEVLADIEADTFWCFSRMLDSIQDYYTFDQLSIQRKIFELAGLVQRTDAELDQHLKDAGIEYLQFAFRWINCLLMREMPMKCIVRIWDAYHAEGDKFGELHLYVCLAFLKKLAPEIKRCHEMFEVMQVLQKPPTASWGYEEVEMIMSEAFMISSLFQGTPSHIM